MAVSTQVYSGSEFKFYFQPETAVGTELNTAMEQVNVDGIISVSQEVIQTLDVRSGSAGRVLHTADIYTRDYNTMTTISVPFVVDSGNLTQFLEAVTGVAVATNVISVVDDWSFTPLAHGGTPTGNTGTFTLCIESPATDESRYFAGCVLQELTLTMESGTDGGRMKGNATFVTKYRPADATGAPSNTTGYGSTWYYLCNYTTKTVGGNDVVLNKIELSFNNPAIYAGCTAGHPEVITRGIPKFTITGALGLKYDANTAALWESRRAGTDIAINLDSSAPVFQIQASHARITGDVNPAETEEGAFIDLPLEFATDGTDDVITLTFV